MADSLNFDPSNDQSFRDLKDTLKPMAINWCAGDVELAKELVQETLYRMYREKRWEKRDLSTYEKFASYSVRVMKNLRNKGFRKQQRRDTLTPKLEQRLDEPVDEMTATEARLHKTSFAKALVRVPAFIGNERAQRFIQCEFVDNLPHEETARKLGLTGRQLTKFKSKFYSQIPRELALRLVGRKSQKD